MAHGAKLYMYIYSGVFWYLVWKIPTADASYLYSDELQSLNVPHEHLAYHLRNSNVKKEHCDASKDCKETKSMPCWGYEQDCHMDNRYSRPICTKHHPQWGVKSLEDQVNLFWEQGDFGYIKKMRGTVLHLCQSSDPEGSSLICTKNLWYCHANNLYMDFSDLNTQRASDRYREDVFKSGQIGGYCEFKEELHRQQGENKSPLQSWFAELRPYSALPFKATAAGKCDVVIDRPTIFIKLDAGINMYHHFCDFVNLFVSQHMNGSFSTDVSIVMWDTSALNYRDFFAETWKAFTRYPIIKLSEFDGKRVCFRDAVFSFLPRMIRGLYYNMPLVPNCQGSGLFSAFSRHLLHRLGIHQEKHSDEEFRITLLARNTQYRNILNQDELVGAMKNVPMFHVKVAEYTHEMSFLDQLKITHNTDIFVGMHGAGLTHMLFLPDWAVVFELYNTEDPECYKDLSSLSAAGKPALNQFTGIEFNTFFTNIYLLDAISVKGVTYLTWEHRAKLHQQDEGHHPTLGAHAKFTNYAFNVDEYMRLIYKAADEVKKNRAKVAHL